MYKIMQEGKVIDLINFPKFIKFLKSGLVTITNSFLAQGIIGSDDETIYCFSSILGKDYPVVTLEEISVEEFEKLQSLLDSSQKADDSVDMLEAAKQTKINSMSAMCKNKIISGFSVKLLDGYDHNFKLTTEDQLNLMLLESQLNSGESYFIYHATDSPCQVYLREDVIRILKTYKAHVIFHTTYFNTLKQYIKTLNDIEKVNSFVYGTDVTDFAVDPVIKQILRNGGVQE